MLVRSNQEGASFCPLNTFVSANRGILATYSIEYMIIQMMAQSRVEPPGVECATKLLEIYPQINEPPKSSEKYGSEFGKVFHTFS